MRRLVFGPGPPPLIVPLAGLSGLSPGLGEQALPLANLRQPSPDAAPELVPVLGVQKVAASADPAEYRLSTALHGPPFNGGLSGSKTTLLVIPSRFWLATRPIPGTRYLCIVRHSSACSVLFSMS